MAQILNDNVITFGPPTATWSDITHFSIWKGGTYIGSSALSNNPDAPQTGASVTFAASACGISIPEGELSSAGSEDTAEGVLDADLQVRLHSGAPGSNGTSNVLSGSGYAHVIVAEADWTIS